MSDLEPIDRSLIEAARPSLEPSAQECDSLRVAVLARVAGNGSGGPSTPPGAGGGGLSSWGVKGALAMALVGVSLGLWLAFGAHRSPSARPAPPAPVRSVPAVPAAVEPSRSQQPEAIAPIEAPAAVEPATPVRSRPPRPRPAPIAAEAPVAAAVPAVEPPATDDVAAEAALLRSARRALTDGDPDSALSRLREHATRFPLGVLQEERGAMLVLALCAAGRSADARDEAGRFLARFPSSVQAERVRAACSRR